MNFETYFNAYHESYTLWAAYEFGDPMEHYSNHDRRERQYLAFRARILRMNAENIEQLAQAEIQERNLNKRIDEYRKEVIEKDEEIRMLEAGIDIRDKALVQVDLEMWRE